MKEQAVKFGKRALGLVFVLFWATGSLYGQIQITPIAEVQRPGPDGNSSALLGQTVTITGRVTVPPGTFNQGSFYVQDATGGVQCYLAGVRLSLGDSVMVTGEVAEYNGETEIVPPNQSSVRFMGKGEPPMPPFFPLAITNREPYEGWVVRTWARIDRIFGSTVFLSDGRGEIKLYVDPDTHIQLTGFSADDAIGVVGVVTEYQGEHEIKPRFQTDLWHSGILPGDGNGEIEASRRTFQILTKDTLSFTVRADTTFSIATLSLRIPDGWQWGGTAQDLEWGGAGLKGASLGYVGPDSLQLSGASVTHTAEGWLRLLRVQAPGFNTESEFRFRTAVSGGKLAPVFRSPVMRVEGGENLMQNLHRVDANGVAQMLGQQVVVEGILTAVAVFPDFAFLQNGQGGIAVFDFSALGGFQRGDQVRISGKVAQRNGLTGLDSVAVLAKLSSGNPVTPYVTTLANVEAQLNDGIEELESRLIQLSNVTVNTSWWQVEGEYTEYQLSDGYRQLRVRIYAGTSLAGLPAPGKPFTMAGILAQDDPDLPYTEGYVLIPRGAEDLRSAAGPAFTTGPELTDVTAGSFTVSWSTSAAARGAVQYGKTSAYEMGEVLDTTVTAEKSLTVGALWPGTIYHARVIAWDQNGGITYSPDLRIITSSHPESTGEVRVYFTRSVEQALATLVPAHGNVDVKSRLIERINAARHSIDLCLYSFDFYNYAQSRDPVVDALVAAKNRGVKIRFIYDSGHNQQSVNLLRNAGIPVIDNRFGGNLAEGIQHNKFIIFDARDTTSFADDWVWTGSFNVTKYSQSSNAENVVLIQDESLAKIYTLEFNEMWGSEGDQPDAGKARFGPRKKDNTPHRLKIAGHWVESYFSPSDGTTAAISQALGTAEKNLAFCLLIFTRDDLYSRLVQVRSAHPGLAVHGVLESENLNQSGSEWPNFQAGNWDVLPDALPGLLHHKYAVVDWATQSDPLVITGSHNWTTGAETVNDENTLILHWPEVADQYWQEFAARYHEAGGGDPLTGVEEHTDAAPVPRDAQLVVYPNPVSRAKVGQVNVLFSLPDFGQTGRAELLLFNLLGQRALEFSLPTPASNGKRVFPLNLKGLAPGLYVLQVRSGRHRLRQKLLIF